MGLKRFIAKNNNLRYEIPYINGVKHGIYKEYYDNGNLEVEKPYINGGIEGIIKSYYKNGNLKSQISFKNERQDGLRQYYENGDMFFQIYYQNNKVIKGKCGNGKIFTNAHVARIQKDINSIREIREHF